VEELLKDVEKRKKLLWEISEFFESLDLKVIGVIQSPVSGQKGNIEYLIYAVKCQTKDS